MWFILRLLIAPKSVISGFILDLIPEKVRKIIGSILLIFGSVLFLWAWFTPSDSGDVAELASFVALIVGLSSIFFGSYFLMYGWDPFLWYFEQEEDTSTESIVKNRKQQIDCSSCNQKLNVPLSYSGKISCPACGIYIALDEGIIQAEGLPSLHS